MMTPKRRGRPTAVEKNTWYLVRRFEGGLIEFENACGNRMRIQFCNCAWCGQSCPEGKIISFKGDFICPECYSRKTVARSCQSEADAVRLEITERTKFPSSGRERREFRLARATPKWVDRGEIAEIYERARRLTKETGILHEVDHYFPLASPVASGLHVPANLKILVGDKNRWKSNKFPLDYSPVWDGMSEEEVADEMMEMVAAYRTERRNLRIAKKI